MWHIGKILALDLKNPALKRSTGTGHSKETIPNQSYHYSKSKKTECIFSFRKVWSHVYLWLNK
jgi:hypothetical protein